jgi:hypothetical protein
MGCIRCRKTAVAYPTLIQEREHGIKEPAFLLFKTSLPVKMQQPGTGGVLKRLPLVEVAGT